MRKKYAIAAVALVLGMGAAVGQINSPRAVGHLARASEFLASGTPRGALDQLRTLGETRLSDDEAGRKALSEAAGEFGCGNYGAARRALENYLREQPYSPLRNEILKGIGDCQLAAGNTEGAMKTYRAVETSGLSASSDGELNYSMGLCAYAMGDKALARTKFEAASKGESGRSAALYYLGVLDYEAGDYAAAKKRFQSVNTAVAPGDMAPYYLAEIEFAEGSWSRAAGEAKRLLRRNIKDADARNEMLRIAGESLVRSGDQREGMDLLQQYAKECKAPAASALYLLGLGEYEQGNYAAAVETLRRVCDDASAEEVIRQSAYLYIGQGLMHEGDDSAALLAFDKASKMEGDAGVREAAFYNYAVARFSGASVPFGSSAETFEEFLRIYPSGQYSDRVREYLVQGYLADHDYKRALERLRGIRQPGDDIQRAKQHILYALGSKAYSAGNLDEARKMLDEAATLAKYNRETAAEVSLLQGECLLREGNYTGAAEKIRAYQKTAARTSPNRAIARYGLGYALFGAKKYREAATEFKAIGGGELSPEARADVLNRLGDIAYYSSDFDEAANYYTQAYEANPRSGDYAAFNRAKMYGYDREYEKKLAALNSFREEFPGSSLMPDVLLETTQAQISLGRNEAAVETYRKLTGTYPQTAQGRQGYLQMALTLLDMDRKEDAIGAYRDVIRLYPTSEEALQASGLLKKLYSESGRGNEYLAFMESVDHAPQVSAEEAERLRYETALSELNKAERSQAANAAALAEAMLERYPDSGGAETALKILAESDYAAGRIPESLARWTQLEEKASGAAMSGVARLGKMRAARDMGDYELAGSVAEQILASSASSPALSEARFTRGLALDAAGKSDEAIALWKELADSPSELYGAKGAVYAAETLLENGKSGEALKVAKEFTGSGSGQRYWVARGFIVIADCYKAQGKAFEAKEYLEALRDNYPGNETDIMTMIETRLSE